MRIISGTARGSQLFSPEGEDTRPTLDRVREAVFSMILEHVPQATVLDLFAGSGAMGLEALSRGADFVDFVDLSRQACAVVSKNITKTRLDRCSVHNCDFKSFLDKCGKTYDLIFLDPPYQAGYYTQALDTIREYALLDAGGIVVAECSKGTELDCRDYEIYRQRTYGKVTVYILRPPKEKA